MELLQDRNIAQHSPSHPNTNTPYSLSGSFCTEGYTNRPTTSKNQQSTSTRAQANLRIAPKEVASRTCPDISDKKPTNINTTLGVSRARSDILRSVLAPLKTP